MATCMTKDLKEIMLQLIEKEVPHTALESVMNAFPTCESIGISFSRAGKAITEAKARQPAEVWPDAVLHKEDGSTEKGSISGLFRDEFGIPVTEDIVCRITREGQPECRALSAVENWQNRGYIVRGDGEPSPVIEKGMGTGEIDRMYKGWKSKLIDEKKVINIYHPGNPEIKPKKGK